MATTATGIPQDTGIRIRTIGIKDVDDALKKGWEDFRRAPLYGLFFSLVYVVTGIALWVFFTFSGQLWWIIPFAMGFPLVAPFAAIGLYEVSRRLESGRELRVNEVLGVIWREKDRQFPFMAIVIFFLFMAWILIAYGIFAAFFGLQAMTHVSTSMALLASFRGVMMLCIGGIAGAVLAGLLFMLTVVSMPLLLDRDVDVVTAMQTSVRAVWANPRPMLSWAGMIASLLFIAMIPAFMGLLIILPVLGHASWHLYRRVVQ